MVFIENFTANNIVLYGFICVLVLYTCTTVLDIKLGHVIALPLIFIFLSLVFYRDTKVYFSDNTELDYKLSSLLDFSDQNVTEKRILGTIADQSLTTGMYDINSSGSNPPPEYFYLDANLINFYYDYKNTFYSYAPKAYIESVRAANALLEIRFNFQRDLSTNVIVPNLQDNYAESYVLRYGEPKKKILANAYAEYLVAENKYRSALNHLQSFILNVPSEPIIHIKQQESLKRLQILLKRNLDIIYNIYKKHKDPSEPAINDYDLQQPSNKLLSSETGEGELFDFY